MITFADFLWMLDEGLVTLDAFYDAEHERCVLRYTWQETENLRRLLEEHDVDLYRLARERAGARLPVVE
jgi:succinate dehydrogenase flavin-adding protein (antitoxin of CptAB toxin-antitoxin module)